MWLVGESDVLFIATNDASGPTLENIGRAWQRPGVAGDLAGTAVDDPFSVLSLYVGGAAELQHYGQHARIQSDDRTTLEFSAPLAIYIPRRNDNASALQALLDPARAPPAIREQFGAAGAREWSNRGRMLLKAHAYSRAFDSFSRSLHLNADSEPALSGLVEAAGSSGRLAEAQHLLESLATAPHGRTEARVALARLLAAMGSYEQAASNAQHLIASDPGDPRGAELLASILADAGDVARLGPLVARMQREHPEREETSYYAAMVSFLTNHLPDAIARAQRIVEANPRHALAWNLIGSASASLGQRDRAREAFRASLVANSQEASTYANLGRLEMESGNRDAAVAYFVESLTLDPHDEIARTSLSAILAANGRR
jgi:tetratricopeptide (TPR) repeat protein